MPCRCAEIGIELCDYHEVSGSEDYMDMSNLEKSLGSNYFNNVGEVY